MALPILDLSDSDLISYLKVVEGFVYSLKISKEIFVSIDGRAKKINDEIFGSSASDIIYNSSHGVSRILVNIEYHLDKLVLERSKVRLSEIRRQLCGPSSSGRQSKEPDFVWAGVHLRPVEGVWQTVALLVSQDEEGRGLGLTVSLVWLRFGLGSGQQDD